MKNIVIIGGGTGTFTLLSGLREYPSNNSVIVSSADDGGSTGILRRDLGVMPPGDIRQCLVGLSYTQKEMRELFDFRFAEGVLKGHTAGNVIIAALEKITGSIDESINLASKMLNVRGQVLPVTLKATTLSAVLTNGKKVVGEHNLDEANWKSARGGSAFSGNAESRIKKLELKPNGPANPKALEAIKNADVIIFGPGDLFTSTIPNLLVKGVKEAVNKSKAKKVLITNLMTKHGQTDGFNASDFVKTLEKYLSDPSSQGGAKAGKIDYVLANNKKPSAEILKKYAKEKAKFVEVDVRELAELKVESVVQDFISNQVIKPKAGDVLKRSMLRHDCDKLAKVIWQLI